MEFRLQIASDVIRDGLGIELINEANHVGVEVFRCDGDNTLVLSTYSGALPLIQIDRLTSFARSRLGPFEDGTLFPPSLLLE